MSQTAKRRIRLLAVASVLSLVGIGFLAVKFWEAKASWALVALDNPVARWALLWLLGGMVVLGILVAVMIRLQPARLHGHPKALHGDQDGTATVEFVMLMPFALLITLLITQAALLFQANMTVNYAAYAAGREASVALSLDLPNEGGMHNLVNNPDYPLSGHSTKLDLIKRAACLALIPVSGVCDTPPAPDPGIDTLTDLTDPGGQVIADQTKALFSSFGADTHGWMGRVQKKYNYALRYTEVTMDKPQHWIDDGNPDTGCPYSASKPITGYENWNWDTGNFQETINGTTYTNGLPYCPHFDAQMDYYKWEELHVHLKYQFLLDVPYTGILLGGTKVQVPGVQGMSWQVEIKTNCDVMNEGGPDPKPAPAVP